VRLSNGLRAGEREKFLAEEYLVRAKSFQMPQKTVENCGCSIDARKI
jgi:hypothetical protein